MSELRQVYTSVDNRDRIIEAALRVFSEVGFAGATMRAVAKAAEVSPGLIHHHFKDKESLWNLVGERISAEFMDAVSVETDRADPAEALRQILANYQRYWKEHPLALRFQLWRVMGAPEEERKTRSKLLNEYFVPKFKQAQQAGMVRDDVPAGLAMITVGGLIQYFLHSHVEAEGAVAITGGSFPNDNEILDYLFSLIAPVRSVDGQKV